MSRQFPVTYMPRLTKPFVVPSDLFEDLERAANVKLRLKRQQTGGGSSLRIGANSN